MEYFTHIPAMECNIQSYIIPVIAATICGMLVGIEREWKGKPAGIRSNVLICVGCALFARISIDFTGEQMADPTRIISQIVTGIGFLGGGVILKNEDKIVGITTAAFIWIVSSMGILAGCGYFSTPIILTLGLVIVSISLEYLELLIKRIKNE